jgi:ABC-type multidrug transport system fused ATPase/permease subunit
VKLLQALTSLLSGDHGRSRNTRNTTLNSDLSQVWLVLADRKASFAAMVAVGLTGSILEAVAVSLISWVLYLWIAAADPARPPAMLQHLFGFDPSDLFRGNLWLACMIVVAVVLARTAAVSIYAVTAASLKSLVFHRLRMRLYQRFMFAPYQDMSRESLGFLTNALQVEAPRVAELIDQLFRIPINAIGAFVFFLVLLALSWPVACFVAISGLGIAILMQFSRVYLHGLGHRLLVLHEDLASRMLAGVQSLRTIRAFGAEEREFSRFAEASRSVALMLVRFIAVENIVLPSASLAALAMIALVILFSSALGNEAATTLTIVALLFRLQPQLQSLQSSLTSIYGLESSLALVVRIINEETPARPRSKNCPAHVKLRGPIRFRDVSYRHPNAPEPTLKELNFEIPQGLMTAIVGQSGAGKTTILNLLLRLTEPSAGTIEIDGVSLSSIDRLSWLRRVAIAGQDIDVLNCSVMENLKLGRPDLLSEEAMDALAVAGIAEFVGALPDRLETRLGERGQRLSGGQRQRIALARAIIMQPQLLILDEATNSVDAALEVAIYRRLRTTLPDVTILIVAHRSSALSEADVIINIADGRVSSVKQLHQTAAN